MRFLGFQCITISLCKLLLYDGFFDKRGNFLVLYLHLNQLVDFDALRVWTIRPSAGQKTCGGGNSKQASPSAMNWWRWVKSVLKSRRKSIELIFSLKLIWVHDLIQAVLDVKNF